MIRCGFCGFEFPQEEGLPSCGKCGIPGGCRMVRCPKCLYENPPELQMGKKLKELFGRKKE